MAATALVAVASSWLAGPVPPAQAAQPSSSTPSVEAVCGPANPGSARCFALLRTDIAAVPANGLTPLAVTPSGYGPADLQDAYAVPGGSAGTGMTVAVVDAYDLPTAESDLAVYRSQYGLPACTTANGCFRKVDQNGGTNYPAANVGWGMEIALDIQMVSAICPNCHILLVETNSASGSDLAAGVDRAVAMGAVAVSNSYGLWEAYGYTNDSHYDHPGVAITAATGDCGYDCAPGSGGYVVGVEFPASSSHVVAVGGTSLVRDGSARGWSESAWGDIAHQSGAGSGCSTIFAKPSWQQDANCANRMVGDVSAVADPYATGVAVYDSSITPPGWLVAGGTSAASPIIASLFALAGNPAAGTYPASYLYANPAALYDVTSGSNNVWSYSCPHSYFCTGVAGYDGPTGLGTPNGTAAFHFQADVPGKPTNVAAVPGNKQATVSWHAPASDGGSTITSYTATSDPDSKTCGWTTGPLSCTVTGLTNGTSYTFTVTATNGEGTGPPSDPSAAVIPHAGGATYYPVSPYRVLDSRLNKGGTRFASQVKQTVLIATAASGVPTNAVAVTGNLTVTGQTYKGYLSVAPALTSHVEPATSTLNFPVGDNRANGVTVPLASGGKLDFMYWTTRTSDRAQIIFDVTGYFLSDP